MRSRKSRSTHHSATGRIVARRRALIDVRVFLVVIYDAFSLTIISLVCFTANMCRCSLGCTASRATSPTASSPCGASGAASAASTYRSAVCLFVGFVCLFSHVRWCLGVCLFRGVPVACRCDVDRAERTRCQVNCLV